MSNTPTGAPEIIDQAWRKDALKGSAYELTYAGTLSYARRRYSRDLQGVDIAVSGIPFDSAVTNRPGAGSAARGAGGLDPTRRAELISLWLRSLRHAGRGGLWRLRR